LPEQNVELAPLRITTQEHARTIGHRPRLDKQGNIAGITEERDAGCGGSFEGQHKPEEDLMRKFIVSLAAAGALGIGVVAALQAGAEASPAGHSSSASQDRSADLAFTTQMIARHAIDVPPPGLSAGDSFVIYGLVHRHGRLDGRSTASCVYTYTHGPVLLVCTVDYALTNGLIVTSAYSAKGGAVDMLVVEGGNGAYANVRGFGTLQPTSTGSDVTLHLTR
jgi:hypothetical protein